MVASLEMKIIMVTIGKQLPIRSKGYLWGVNRMSKEKATRGYK